MRHKSAWDPIKCNDIVKDSEQKRETQIDRSGMSKMTYTRTEQSTTKNLVNVETSILERKQSKYFQVSSYVFMVGWIN